jgi:tRNA A58 N-methylase Trm61
LDIKQPSKAKDNVIKILKPGGILIVWVPTANQVIDVLQAYKGDFFPDQIVQIGQNQWIRIAERFRPEDWQAGYRGFIIKFVKVK